MVDIVVQWILSGLALYMVSRIIPGVILDGFGSALIAVVIMGIVNIGIKPLLVIISLPITIITFGLFILIINALLFLLTSVLTPGFDIRGFGSAILGSLLYGVLLAVLRSLIRS